MALLGLYLPKTMKIFKTRSSKSSRTIQVTGNRAYYVTIPVEIVRKLELRKGSRVEVALINTTGEIIIYKSNKNKWKT